jgi:prepilin-type N-terminal cleavage/methylation domain-containing protein
MPASLDTHRAAARPTAAGGWARRGREGSRKRRWPIGCAAGVLAARLRDERGYTLIELLSAIVVSLIVLGAITTLLVLSQRIETRDANYTYAQDDARAGLDRMVSQIRQAWNIVSAGPNSVDMDVNLGGQPYQVYYECDIPQPGTPYNECVRLQLQVGAPLPSLAGAPVAIRELENGTATNPVFSWGPSPIAPYYMTATIDVPASDGGTTKDGLGFSHTIVISDGALMRNENIQN